MDISGILKAIDQQISQLQEARVSIAALAATPTKGKRGRPKGSKNQTIKAVKSAAKPRKHNLSPEGRRAIADAMKRRWANQRKAQTK